MEKDKLVNAKIGDFLEAMKILVDIWNEGESTFDGFFIPIFLLKTENALKATIEGWADGHGPNYIRQYEYIYDDYPSIKKLL